jgi:hypothetical protein
LKGAENEKEERKSVKEWKELNGDINVCWKEENGVRKIEKSEMRERERELPRRLI